MGGILRCLKREFGKESVTLGFELNIFVTRKRCSFTKDEDVFCKDVGANNLLLQPRLEVLRIPRLIIFPRFFGSLLISLHSSE